MATDKEACAPNLHRLFVLGNEAKQTMFFIRYSGGKINAVAQRKKIPQPIKLQRRAIGAHQRFYESSGDGIVIVDQTVTEVTNPKFAIHQSESPWRIEMPV